MKNAILIPGWGTKDEFYNPDFPTPSNAHWFPWLSKQLMVKDIHTVSLEMPHSYDPEYSVWKKELERFIIDDQTLLVGHSCGAGFLVRWLSENKNVNADKVVLVAPWMGIDPDRPFYDKDFFTFKFDDQLAKRTAGIIILNSTDDSQPIQDSVALIRKSIADVRYCEVTGKGHFTIESMGAEELPELLEAIVR
jgi:predicted alpha/beta hydrolase family esterase